MRKMARIGMLVSVAFLTLAAVAQAGSVTLVLNRASLTNVDDAAGRWQHEGGTVFKGAVQVGNYAIHRRVTNGGTNAQNTSMWTCEIFFTPLNPPENIVMQGAHSFGNGQVKGSISAASFRFTWLKNIGAYVTLVPGAAINLQNLTITWPGATQLTLP